MPGEGGGSSPVLCPLVPFLLSAAYSGALWAQVFLSGPWARGAARPGGEAAQGDPARRRRAPPPGAGSLGEEPGGGALPGQRGTQTPQGGRPHRVRRRRLRGEASRRNGGSVQLLDRCGRSCCHRTMVDIPTSPSLALRARSRRGARHGWSHLGGARWGGRASGYGLGPGAPEQGGSRGGGAAPTTATRPAAQYRGKGVGTRHARPRKGGRALGQEASGEALP